MIGTEWEPEARIELIVSRQIVMRSGSSRKSNWAGWESMIYRNHMITASTQPIQSFIQTSQLSKVTFIDRDSAPVPGVLWIFWALFCSSHCFTNLCVEAQYSSFVPLSISKDPPADLIDITTTTTMIVTASLSYNSFSNCICEWLNPQLYRCMYRTSP